MDIKYVLDIVKTVLIVAVPIALMTLLIMSLFDEKLYNAVITFFVLSSPLVALLLMATESEARERR